MDESKIIIDKIRSMNNNEISSAIENVANLLGINNNAVKMLCRNPEFVRNKAENIREEEIDKIKKSIGEDEIQSIKKMIGINSDGR